MRRSMPAWIFLIALYGLAGVQVCVAYLFWSGFDTPSAFERYVFIAIGCGLAIAEIFALVIASEAATRREFAKAWAMRLLFAALAAINLTADLAAVSTLTGRDDAERAQTLAARQRTDDRRLAVADDITRLKQQLQAQNLDLPPAAIAAERDAVAGRRDRYIAEGLTPPDRLVTQAARLEGAYVTATRIAELEAERDQLDNALLATPPVAAHHPQFETIAQLATSVGVKADAEGARAALAFFLALVLKATLAFGFWGATPRRIPEEEEKGPSAAKPAAPHSSATPSMEIVSMSKIAEPEAGEGPPLTLPPARPKRRKPARTPPSRHNAEAIKALAGKTKTRSGTGGD